MVVNMSNLVKLWLVTQFHWIGSIMVGLPFDIPPIFVYIPHLSRQKWKQVNGHSSKFNSFSASFSTQIHLTHFQTYSHCFGITDYPLHSIVSSLHHRWLCDSWPRFIHSINWLLFARCNRQTILPRTWKNSTFGQTSEYSLLLVRHNYVHVS